MGFDVAGLGNALVDALVIVDDDTILKDLDLVKGTMHPVDHDRWQEVYERLRHHHVTFDSGGSCANAIAALGRLGARAIYCGQVGDDQMGLMYADRMKQACGQHAVRFTSAQPTGKCLSIITRHDAERTMLTDLGAATKLPELGDFAQVLQEVRVAHFTGYTLLDPTMRGTVIEAMATVTRHGGRVSIDAADPFVVLALRDLLWELVDRHADIVFLNAEEAEMLTGETPERAVTFIAEKARVETVVVKLGSRGSLVNHRGQVHEIGIRPVEAVDTTGAGDAYAGGFLYGVVNGWDPRPCGELGAAIAAQTVAQVGAVVKDRERLAALLGEVLGDERQRLGA